MATSIIRNVQLCGLEHIKNVTHQRQHGWHFIDQSRNINNLCEVEDKFARNQFEICAGKAD